MNYIKYTYTGIFALLLISSSLVGQDTLTIQEAIEHTLNFNYDIRIAKNTVSTASNNRSIYNTGQLPTANFNSGGTYNRSNQNIKTQDGNQINVNGAETKSVNASVNVNYVIFDGFGRKYNIEQLMESESLSKAEAQLVIESAIFELYNQYFRTAQLANNLELLNQTMVLSSERLKRLQAQAKYGQATRLDILNAEVDYKNDSLNYIIRIQEYNNSKRNLGKIIGFEVTRPLSATLPVQLEDSYTFDQVFAKTLDHNLNLKTLSLREKISHLDIKKSKASLLPQVSINSSYAWNFSRNPATSFLAQSNNHGLNTGLNLTWNVFDGGRQKIQRQNLRIALDNNKLNKEKIINDVSIDIQNTLDNLGTNLALMNVQKMNIETNKLNFERSKQQFDSGQISSVEFRQSQLNLLNAELQLNDLKTNTKLIEIQLLFWMGELLDQ